MNAPWPTPAPGEVHLFRASLAGPAGDLAAWLSPDERARRDRYAFEHLRERFARGRGLLRAVLGRCLGVAPGAIAFAYGPHEKPALPGHPLHFNLSHADDEWLLAVSRDRPVGVDIEATRPLADFEAMVRRFFAPGERAHMAVLAPEDRLAAFYRGWTRKEAVMKVTGRGMALPLDAFEVTLAPDDARLLSLEGDPAAAARWSLVDLPAPAGFAAALAVAGADWRLQPAIRLEDGFY